MRNRDILSKDDAVVQGLVYNMIACSEECNDDSFIVIDCGTCTILEGDNKEVLPSVLPPQISGNRLRCS